MHIPRMSDSQSNQLHRLITHLKILSAFYSFTEETFVSTGFESVVNKEHWLQAWATKWLAPVKVVSNPLRLEGTDDVNAHLRSLANEVQPSLVNQRVTFKSDKSTPYTVHLTCPISVQAILDAARPFVLQSFATSIRDVWINEFNDEHLVLYLHLNYE